MPDLSTAFPNATGGLLVRHHLVERLQKQPGLTALRAAAGFGKTTLLSLARTDTTTVWFTCQPGPDSPLARLKALADSCIQACLFPLLPSEQASQPAAGEYLAAIRDALLRKPTGCLVIDDAHLLSDDFLQMLGDELFDALPVGWQIRIAGHRDLPDDMVSRWARRDRYTLISDADLTLSEAEIRALGRLAANQGLTIKEAAQIHRQTGGWALGVRLMLAAGDPVGRDDVPAGPDDPVTRLIPFVSTIATRLPDYLQQVVWRASLLPEIVLPDSAGLLGLPDLATALAVLHEDHGLVHRTDAGTYQFYRLIRACLVQIGRRYLPDSERYSLLAAAAATRNGHDTIELCLDAGEPDLALTHLHRAPIQLTRHAQAAALEALLARFPEHLHTDPWWQALHAANLIARGNTEKGLVIARSLLHAADPRLCRFVRFTVANANVILARRQDPAELQALLDDLGDDDPSLQVRTATIAGINHHLSQDYDAAVMAYQQALAIALPPETAPDHSIALANLATIAGETARYHQSDLWIRQALVIDPDTVTLLAPLMGTLALIRGQTADAMAIYDRGLVRACTLGKSSHEIRIRLERIAACWLQGHYDEGDHDLSAVEAWMTANPYTGVLMTNYLLLRAEQAWRHGCPAKATALAREAVPDPLAPELLPCLLWTTIRLALAMGRHREAEPWLRHGLARTRQLGLHHTEVRLLIQEAALRHALGEPEAAEAAMVRCRQLVDLDALPGLLDEAHIVTRSGALRKPDLAIGLFGGLRLTIGNENQTDSLGSSAHLLLIQLAIHPDGCSRRELEAALFQDGDPSGNAVAMAIGRMRKRLDEALGTSDGQAIIYTEGRYRLAPSLSIHCDLSRFEQRWRLMTDAISDLDRAAACERLMAIYQGPLLPGFERIGWIRTLQEEARQVWRACSIWLMTWRLLDRQLTLALALADRHLEFEPMDEIVQRFKLATLQTYGLHEAARRHAARLRTMAGADWDPALGDLITAILGPEGTTQS